MENNNINTINEEEEIGAVEEGLDRGNEVEKPDHLEDLQRLQAEFENFMKRSIIEKQESLKYSNEKLVFKLLSVIDSLELALKHNSDEGVKLIYSNLLSILESEGLSKISTEGLFDPKFHEALIQEDGEIDNKIIEELQVGYMFEGKVIRPTKVKITRIKNE